MVQIILKMKSKYTYHPGSEVPINRADWCNMENVKIIQDCIYSKLVDAGIAKQLTGEGNLLDEDGTTSGNTMDQKTKFKLTHPN